MLAFEPSGSSSERGSGARTGGADSESGEGSRRSPVSPPFGRGVNPHARVSNRQHLEGTNESATCAGKRDEMHSKHPELLGGISSRTLRVALTLLSESVLPRSPSRLSLCCSRLLQASRAIACGTEVRVFYPLGPDMTGHSGQKTCRRTSAQMMSQARDNPMCERGA